jgi:hypothetical protein
MYEKIRPLAIASLVAGGCLLSAVPAEASTASQIKKLQHDLKVVSARQKADRAFINCLQTVNLTQYGAEDGSFGYMYDNDMFNPASIPFATTGIDVAQAGDGYSTLLMLDPACTGGRSSRARAFGPMIPPGTMAYAIRKGD